MPTRTARKPNKRKANRPVHEPPPSVRLGGKTFIILPEGEYRCLRGESGKLSAQDRGDIAEARRRLADPSRRPLPYADARKLLGHLSHRVQILPAAMSDGPDA